MEAETVAAVAAVAGAEVDPEMAFLASTREEKQQTEYDWELYKENIRPLKRGRNVKLLNQSLRSQTDNALKKSLLQTRRRLVEAIDEYKGEDPLQPWLDCIKWVQESFPTGGDCSGLVVIYEQCVRTFWHDERYKDDLRYLKVWLEYAENCADAQVIYKFLEANQIGQSHSIYYSAYALHMESKNKLTSANDIFNLGIARRAEPLAKLEATYSSFLVRSSRKRRATEDGSADNHLESRSFGTVLSSEGARRQLTENSDVVRKNVKLQRVPIKSLSVYNENSEVACQSEHLKSNDSCWHTLGTRSDRNKENTSVPAKWSSYKVPQKIGTRTGQAASRNCIEVFVDDECADLPKVEAAKSLKSSVLQLRKANSQSLKKETELLKEDPLRNFPPKSLR